MKRLITALLVIGLPVALMSTQIHASNMAEEKPTQHLKVAEVTSMEQAKKVFLMKTAEMMSKQQIDQKAAADIHIITYTLEQSVAYFTENLTGEKQALATQMAEVVERIHLTSETSRTDQLKTHLGEYYQLVDQFLFSF
ncbi:DUF6746 family protein [Shewanella maritima]|uniref:DUF6746 family protein n=1 Tax=Shewanella maritima TaxID=2520507 RepID=UPI003735AC9E